LEDLLPYEDGHGERVEVSVDDVVASGEEDNDLLIIDAVCRQFEAISGAILNRSHKTTVLSRLASAMD
jgi:hypothetical protein